MTIIAHNNEKNHGVKKTTKPSASSGVGLPGFNVSPKMLSGVDLGPVSEKNMG